ncbi:MAG: RNA polymerase factor sigma-54 [Candidatus Omnitrophica bacterium]|nr:RNA polymerase factor sigma-54 [Candidatus Omnitrophota bacterium]
MEPRLSQTTSQKLILAPQLRQFLKLLELPIFELEQKLQQELEQNPVLEEIKPEGETEDASADAETEAESEPEGIDDYEPGGNEDDLSRQFVQEDSKEKQRKRDYQESILTKPPTLAEYLDWQLGLIDLSEDERQAANDIIGNINDDGMLAASIEEIAEETNLPQETVELVLKKIQSLDPPGVGGRHLGEALLIQLKKQNQNTKLAEAIVQNHLPLLERKQFDQLARTLSVPLQKVKEVYQQISRLEPKPGRIFYQEKPNFVIPDATVSLATDQENELVLELNDRFVPTLRINPMYREMLKKKDLDPKTKVFLREKVQSGFDLIRAISQRKSTIRQITEELLKAQPDFFTKGFAYLKPLRLKDIAAKIGVHESTVSRAIQGKYMDTPQGTIPYKSFFSSKLERGDGSVESQKSATERLKALIAAEDPRKPLSDAKLVKLLEQDGVQVARRTVAKYRDILKILPAYLRKK